MNLFVVEPSKMATFVRRVPFLVYIFVIFNFKLCISQPGGKDFKRDRGALNLNPNPLNVGGNINPNAIPGNFAPAGPAGGQFQQQQQQGQFNNLPLQQQNVIPPGGGQGQGMQLGGLKAQPAGFGKPGGLKYPGGQSPLKTLMLAEHPDCAEDIARVCSKTMRKNNFAVLDCLQDRVEEHYQSDKQFGPRSGLTWAQIVVKFISRRQKSPEEMSQVSENCQHLVWEYKRNLTKDDRFESAQKEVCLRELQEYQDCQRLPLGTGQRIPCLIEHKQNITGPCHHFLNRMAKIVFSDYQLVWHFMENCNDDIRTFKCGRSETKPNQTHSQGETMKCLAQHLRQLAKVCKRQVLRVAELQSDDYHLDRPLYYACREDREHLCGDVEAGGGRVFECLFNHKASREMTDKCRELLTLRQQIMAEDVKVDMTFFRACKQDIMRHQCLQGPVDDQEWTRSVILLCLENALKTDHKVNGECISEMKELRAELMEDYQITPELVVGCNLEIQNFCQGLGPDGKTIHCLMKHVNPRTKKAHDFRPDCQAAIENLLQEADVSEDIKIDHVLARACSPVLESVCQPAHVQHTGVLNCLLDKLDDESMTDECEDRLLEIQYFVVRDFKLDHILYKMCHQDAIDHCHASRDWANQMPGADNSPMVFPCLYRLMKTEEGPSVSRPCRREIKRTMRERAHAVDLEPQIEEACLYDLGEHCSEKDKYEREEEIQCLQDNYEDLRDECQDAIGNFTEDEDEDIELDTILMRACTPMIKKFCADILEDDPDAGDVMDCLIKHKHHRDMNEKCAAGVEHHQLTQLKDFRFSHKFKEACKKSVLKHCQGKVKKNEIIICLSEIVREDVLREGDMRVEKECRQQLNVEVLRRGEDIRLDPELHSACKTDIEKLCHGKKAGNAEVLECLKDNQPQLSQQCHKLIFRREKVEVIENLGDFTLFKVCKSMIKVHCSMEMNNGQNDVMDCLKRVKNIEGFDPTCRTYVMKRQLEESKDWRLNPSLLKRCRMDIPKFCSDVAKEQDTEVEGKVIHCLKQQYVKKRLSSDCTEEIRSLVKETAMNINLDPVLMKACKEEIPRLCGPELKAHEDRPHAAGGDAIEECLKKNMFEGKLRVNSPCGREVMLLADESRVDVNVDPQLHMACQSDLIRFCQEIESGQGQKMSCLLSVLEDHPKKLKPSCYKILNQRKTLWEFAANPAPPETLEDLGSSVLASRSKTYLIGVLMTIVGVIFIVGISCGRVTKRVPLSMKNK